MAREFPLVELTLVSSTTWLPAIVPLRINSLLEIAEVAVLLLSISVDAATSTNALATNESQGQFRYLEDWEATGIPRSRARSESSAPNCSSTGIPLHSPYPRGVLSH